MAKLRAGGAEAIWYKSLSRNMHHPASGRMSGEAKYNFDFFLSRRGSVAALAREVANVLTEKGYKVFVQDYDIQFGTSFIEAMHEAIKNARDLVILFSRDYEESPYTRREF